MLISHYRGLFARPMRASFVPGAMVRVELPEVLLVTTLLLVDRHGASPREAMREEHFIVDSLSRQVEDRNRVHFGDFPFLVFVERRPDTHVCDGSVVSRYWVVTSAEKISTVPLAIRSGIKVRAGSLERGRGGVLHQTTRVITHPLFNQPHMYENDIALLKVKTSFTHDNYVKPVNMATLADVLPPGSELIACGWGKGRRGGMSEHLRRTTLHVVSNQKCEASRGIRRLREQLGPQVHVTDSMICATAHGKDTTLGDSGGPLFLVHDEKPLLVGVISWGEGRGDQDSPGVYTSIAKFRKWMFLEMATASLLHAGSANDTADLP